ncbi:MAG: PAS domain-containing protein [Desulfobacteraceae bacterium]|nr:PAS domain-containing protein [Desulfobacteraceae bacterium]
MSQILMEKGASLIKSFEAATRTGMKSMHWEGQQVQQLLEEVARQPDVLFLIVTDKKGKILAHNDPSLIDGRYLTENVFASLNPSREENWRITEKKGDRAFEVYREFIPFSRDDIQISGRDEGCCPGCANAWFFPKNNTKQNQIIFVGFDISPFEDARKEDVRNTVIVSTVLLILGITGFLTLFVAQSYRSTKRQLQDTSAVANEVVTNMPVGLLVLGRSGQIVLLNTAAESITGLSFNVVQGKPFDSLLPTELVEMVATLEPDEGKLDREMDYVFADGPSIPLSVTAARIINDDGEFVGNVLLLIDLKEIKQLREAVSRKEKLAAIGGLAAGVAHEIRNPLSSIKGMASFFRDKFPDGSDDNEAAGVMIKEVDRLNRVISELLEFARPSKIDLKASDINAVLDHSVRLIGQDADVKNIKIDLETNNNLPAVMLDPDRFTQCLLNLYLNSIQSMVSGGKLTVRSDSNEDKFVEVTVKDTGAGIQKKDLNHVFDPYFTTKPTGTGLGLAILHKIVEAHEGKITVYSEPHKGTTFTIQIPIATV